MEASTSKNELLRRQQLGEYVTAAIFPTIALDGQLASARVSRALFEHAQQQPTPASHPETGDTFDASDAQLWIGDFMKDLTPEQAHYRWFANTDPTNLSRLMNDIATLQEAHPDYSDARLCTELRLRYDQPSPDDLYAKQALLLLDALAKGNFKTTRLPSLPKATTNTPPATHTPIVIML